jgi:hypothetical protein
MNHTNIAIVGILAIATVLIGTVGVSMSIQQQRAAAQNVTDIENSETNFIFKQKLKNNCSGFSTCSNAAAESLVAPTPPGGG